MIHRHRPQAARQSNTTPVTLPVFLSVAAPLAILALAIGYLAPLKVHAAAEIHSQVPSQAPTPAPSNPPVVVELFTSEGCSSCPPADTLLAQIDATQSNPAAPRVIVLSEHVTYWNHDGWTDPYSLQSFTDRQNQYGSRFNLQDVYTPQAVIDGARQLVGSNRKAVIEAIQSAASQPKIPVTLENTRWSSDSSATAALTTGPISTPVTVFAALADDSDLSNVLHGENQGQALHHTAVVRTLQELRKLKSPLTREPIKIQLSKGIKPQAKMRLIVFLADSKSGRIVGASMQPLAL